MGQTYIAIRTARPINHLAMDMQKALICALSVIAISSLLQALFVIKRRRARLHLLPKGPPTSWPILGHLPFLADGCPHHALATLSRTPGYGPGLIGLRLGSKLAVVACSTDVARELLFTQDKSFANRPHFQFVDSVFYGFDVGIAFSNYNPRWVKLRRICALELFTAKRLHALQHVREEEVRRLLNTLFQASCQGTQAVDLGECLMKMSANSISRLLHSKTLADVGGDSYMALLAEQEREVAPILGDFIPCLKVLDALRKRKRQHLHDRINVIIEKIICERRKAMKTCQAHELPQDFLQVLLSREASNHEKGDDQHQFPEEELITTKEIKGTIFDILSAGTHTTALTLEWAMAELLRNRRCLNMLREEIDGVMGKGNQQLVTDEDLPKLPYLKNTVKEVFRLHPVVPLLVPHISHTEAKVDRYTLPANTLVFVNVWALGRDPSVWENAEAFVPERFEGKEVDVRGQHFELLPFGAGRRMCPGMRVALSVVHLTLANLVKAFDWELPHGQSHTDLDMSERRGLTSCRNTPLLVIPKPRR